MAGLTSAGFERKTLDQILEDLNAEVVNVFGVANTGPDSVFGQYDGIISEIASDLWEQSELVYQSSYPSSAIGVALDNVAELNNLTRLPAIPSVGQIILQGDEGTVVPIGTQVSQVNTNEIFQTTVAVTITDDVASRFVLSVNNELDAPHSFQLSVIAGFDVVTSNLIVELHILNDLSNQINILSDYTSSVNTTDLTLTIELVDKSNTMAIDFISTGLDLDEIWSPTIAESLNNGPLEMPINSIVNLITSLSGLTGVDNIILGVPGLDAETDDEFRVRRSNSLAVVGAGTVPSIEARLVNDVPNVTACTVIDNRTDSIDVEGRTPHSFEAIVTYPLGDTATELLIAAKIFEIGGAGIETQGDIVNTVIDSQGNPHIIRFSRPEDKYIWAEIEISLFDEEIFPATGIVQIQESITTFGNSLGAGQDCIIQRFFDSIYQVAGVENISSFKFGVTENPSDNVATTFSAQTISDEPSPGEYTCTPGNMETDGVVTGMIVSINPGNTIPDSVSAVNDVRFRSRESLYSVTDDVIFGGTAQVNIAINGNAIARFLESRITVTVV